MGRKKIENKEPLEVLSWKLEKSYVDLFENIYAKRGDKTRADMLRSMLTKEGKRHGIERIKPELPKP